MATPKQPLDPKQKEAIAKALASLDRVSQAIKAAKLGGDKTDTALDAVEKLIK